MLMQFSKNAKGSQVNVRTACLKIRNKMKKMKNNHKNRIDQVVLFYYVNQTYVSGQNHPKEFKQQLRVSKTR